MLSATCQRYIWDVAGASHGRGDLEGTLSCSLHWSYIQVSCDLIKEGERGRPSTLVEREPCWDFKWEDVVLEGSISAGYTPCFVY